MAYPHIGAFIADFNFTWSAAITGNPNSPYANQPLQAAHDGWAYYQTARNHAAAGTRLKIGLYPHLIPLLPNLGSVFDPQPGLLFIEDPNQANQAGRWQIYFNDCYILGGIHGHATFELENFNVPVNDPQMIPAHQNDPGFQQLDYVGPTAPAWRLKVTQREVLGLTAYGYSGNNPGGNIRTLTCTQLGEANAATLSGYKQLVDDFAAVV